MHPCKLLSLGPLWIFGGSKTRDLLFCVMSAGSFCQGCGARHPPGLAKWRAAPLRADFRILCESEAARECAGRGIVGSCRLFHHLRAWQYFRKFCDRPREGAPSYLGLVRVSSGSVCPGRRITSTDRRRGTHGTERPAL